MEAVLLIIFIISIALQVAFTLWLALGIKNSELKNSHHSVSVIIAARNEAKNLPRLLETLNTQDHNSFEVIIINDRSTDDTQSILSKHIQQEWLRVITVKDLPSGWNGKKHALQLGIEAAQNEVLLFTDGDCLPNSNQWISKMTNAIDQDKKVVLGFSGYVKGGGLLNELTQFDTVSNALQYFGFANRGMPYMAVGRNWAIEKKSYPINLLRKYASISGGDDDLIAQSVCNSKNTCIQTDKKAFTMSIPENSWGTYLKQKMRHLSVGTKYSFRIKTLLGFFPLIHACIGLMLLTLIVSGQWYFAILIFGIRSLSFYIIFRRLGQKLDSHFNYWALPLVEFCYPFWYAFVGIRSLAAKQIEWKAESSFLIKH